MGLLSPLPDGGSSEKTYQVQLETNSPMEMRGSFLPAEWEPQSGIQLTWPHKEDRKSTRLNSSHRL